MRKYNMIFILLIVLVGCHQTPKTTAPYYKVEKLPDSVHLVQIGPVESFMQMTIQHNGKTAGFVEVDDLDRWKISAIYDTVGMVHGLVDRLKETSADLDTVGRELQRVRDQLKSMHDFGKCPADELWYEEAVTDSFTLIAGCYTKEEHKRELSDNNCPKLEISATVIQ